MNSSHNNRDDRPTPPSHSTVVLLFGSIADTTWRMFVPTIGLTIAGVAIDNWAHTKPWATVIGIALGVLVAAWLVRRQLKAFNKESN